MEEVKSGRCAVVVKPETIDSRARLVGLCPSDSGRSVVDVVNVEEVEDVRGVVPDRFGTDWAGPFSCGMPLRLPRLSAIVSK